METDQFKGRLSIWVQGLDTSPPDLFQGKRRKTAIIIQGTFKEPLLYENVLTGQEFGRTPTNLPARWLVDSVLLKVRCRSGFLPHNRRYHSANDLLPWLVPPTWPASE